MCDLGQNVQKLMDVTISLAVLVQGSAKCKWAKVKTHVKYSFQTV